MQPIIESVQPYITTIAGAILSLLAAVVIGLVALLKQSIKDWIDARLSVQQRELLHKVASEAFAYAETAYEQGECDKKLAEAMDYVSSQLAKKNIKITPIEMRAAIEKAYLQHQANKP